MSASKWGFGSVHLRFTPTTPGEYEFFCHVDHHGKKGMKLRWSMSGNPAKVRHALADLLGQRARGDAENRIKELFDVAFDRTSCSRFAANQFRVLLAAAAYVLLQDPRPAAGAMLASGARGALRRR